MDNTIKTQILDEFVTLLIQSGSISVEDIARTLLTKTIGTSSPEQLSLFDAPIANTNKGHKLVKGDAITLADENGNLYPFISKVAASLFLNRSSGYVKQCVANGTPIYARTKDGHRGEEYIVWTKNDQGEAKKERENA